MIPACPVRSWSAILTSPSRSLTRTNSSSTSLVYPHSTTFAMSAAQPSPSLPPPYPALGATFPSLAELATTAREAAAPNVLIIACHRPNIKMGLECSLTGRKRKQKGGGDTQRENPGCGFLIQAEVVRAQGRGGLSARGGGEDSPLKFELTHFIDHNHKQPTTAPTKRVIEKKKNSRFSIPLLQPAHAARAAPRQDEHLVNMNEYKVWATSLELTEEETQEMECWPAPNKRIESRLQLQQDNPTEPSDERREQHLQTLPSTSSELSTPHIFEQITETDLVQSPVPSDLSPVEPPQRRSPPSACRPPPTPQATPMLGTHTLDFRPDPYTQQAFEAYSDPAVSLGLDFPPAAYRSATLASPPASATRLTTHEPHLPSPSLSPEPPRGRLQLGPSPAQVVRASDEHLFSQECRRAGAKRTLSSDSRPDAAVPDGAGKGTEAKRIKLEVDASYRELGGLSGGGVLEDRELVKRLEARFIRGGREEASP